MNTYDKARNGMQMVFQFPPIFALHKSYKGNLIRQLILPSYSSEVVVERHAENQIEGYTITQASKDTEKVLAITGTALPPERFDKVLRLISEDLLKKGVTRIDATQAKWIKHPRLSKAQITTEQQELLSVTENYLLETYQLPFGVIASN